LPKGPRPSLGDEELQSACPLACLPGLDDLLVGDLGSCGCEGSGCGGPHVATGEVLSTQTLKGTNGETEATLALEYNVRRTKYTLEILEPTKSRSIIATL